MPTTDADLLHIQSIVLRVTGNVISKSQIHLIEPKLTPLAQRFGLPNVDALIHAARRFPVKFDDAIAEAMTINETSFFRDPQVFESIRTVVLPYLINQRVLTRTLSIWCAACSSGQEPYSLATLLREHFPDLSGWNITITGTDICNEMLDRAREGIYNEVEVRRGLPPEYLSSYFKKKDSLWQISSEIRRQVTFRKLNLISQWNDLPVFDLILARNVLVYFNSQTKESILRRMVSQMASDGYLFLGGGESLVLLKVPFVGEACGKTICFRSPSESDRETSETHFFKCNM